MQIELRRVFWVHFASAVMLASLCAVASADEMTFPKGTATPSETCGDCHASIYREYVLGIGSDTRAANASPQTKAGGALSTSANVSSSATGHASTGTHTHDVNGEKKGYCNGCHFPEPFAISGKGVAHAAGATKPNAGMPETGGLTCAGCHLTPEGDIRAAHSVKAPHRTIADPALQSSALCAHCHTSERRVPGKMFQTYLEWQEDYQKAGLGKEECQDCHMPRTVRKTAEEFDVPPRAVARHLWTGAHSRQRHLNSLSLTVIQPEAGKRNLSFQVTNIGAGHSVPTGTFTRAVFLRVEVQDRKGASIARKEWMFAPSYSDRPDDKAFLEEDKKLPKGGEAARADAQGPHESSIRAGEARVLAWEPLLAPGDYIVKARLLYTLDRFNDKAAADDQSEIGNATLVISAN